VKGYCEDHGFFRQTGRIPNCPACGRRALCEAAAESWTVRFSIAAAVAAAVLFLLAVLTLVFDSLLLGCVFAAVLGAATAVFVWWLA
jgi:hypothetical protein